MGEKGKEKSRESRNERDQGPAAGEGSGSSAGTKKSFLGRMQTFRSLKNPVYRFYFGGMIGQMAGMNMQMMTGSLLIYRVTESAILLGLMALAFAGPMFFFSLFGGVIADRLQKKQVLLAGQVVSGVVSLGIALSLTLGYLSTEYGGSWWILIAAFILQGTVLSLMMPSQQAILRDIVGGEQLLNAASLNSTAMNGFRILGPALAGFLIDAFDFAAVYYLMTGLYFMSSIFIFLMPYAGKRAFVSRGALPDIKDGLTYIRRETIILIVLIVSLVGVVLAMPYIMLMPIFTEDVLDVGATGLGVLMSTSGIGAIIGSLILASLPNKKRGLLFILSTLVSGITLTFFAFFGIWHISLILIVFIGMAHSARMALANTLLQYYSADEYRGRVMSIYMMEVGVMSFGAFGAALLAESVGVQWAIGGFAIVLVVLAALTLVFIPRLRRLD